MRRTAIATVVAVAALTCGVTAKRVLAADAGALLQPGSAAPGFTLPSQENQPVSLDQYKGKYVVLYFYPKDKTSGCTKEAHNFQRDQEKFTAANAAILGVSLDTAESHKSFCTQESLTFKLLADPNHKVVDAYKVPVKNYGVMKFAERVTYLISPDGKVLKVWPDVKVDNHSEEVLQAITEAKKA